jgi:hypothetical protein
MVIVGTSADEGFTSSGRQIRRALLDRTAGGGCPQMILSRSWMHVS